MLNRPETPPRHSPDSLPGDTVSSATVPTDMVARARWLLIISAVTTAIAIATVLAVIGYRLFHTGAGAAGSAPAISVVDLQKNARVTATAVAGDRIVVTIETTGGAEIRTFDAHTMKETGRLRFVPAP